MKSLLATLAVLILTTASPMVRAIEEPKFTVVAFRLPVSIMRILGTTTGSIAWIPTVAREISLLTLHPLLSELSDTGERPLMAEAVWKRG